MRKDITVGILTEFMTVIPTPITTVTLMDTTTDIQKGIWTESKKQGGIKYAPAIRYPDIHSGIEEMR